MSAVNRGSYRLAAVTARDAGKVFVLEFYRVWTFVVSVIVLSAVDAPLAHRVRAVNDGVSLAPAFPAGHSVLGKLVAPSPFGDRLAAVMIQKLETQVVHFVRVELVRIVRVERVARGAQDVGHFAFLRRILDPQRPFVLVLAVLYRLLALRQLVEIDFRVVAAEKVVVVVRLVVCVVLFRLPHKIVFNNNTSVPLGSDFDRKVL